MQQVLNPYSPIHKHIEARMNMVRKTAKQFYIKKYSLSDVGIFLFSHHVAMALSSALQGLTSVFGMGTGGPPASSTPTVDSEYSFGSPNWARTSDIMINSHALYRLSYGGISVICSDFSEITSKIQSNVRYLNVRSHYRLSYGGS